MLRTHAYVYNKERRAPPLGLFCSSSSQRRCPEVMWRVLAVAVMAAALAGGVRAQIPMLQCPPGTEDRCELTGMSSRGEYIVTVDGNNFRIKVSRDAVELECYGEVGFDCDAMPRFDAPQNVRTVKVRRCAPPANASYARALAALGVVPPEKAKTDVDAEPVNGYRNLNVLATQAGHVPTRDYHFADLDALLRLEVSFSGGGPPPPVDAPLLTGRLLTLRMIRLSGVRLTPEGLLALPPSLRELQLVRTGAAAGALPDTALLRLPRLNTLIVEESGEGGASLAPGVVPLLGALTLRAPDGPALLVGPMPPNLTTLDLVWGKHGEPPEPPSWHRSCSLLKLILTDKSVPRGNRLASEATLQLASWVRGCSALSVLWVWAPLEAVPDTLLGGMPALQDLKLSRCSLRALPPGLLVGAPALTAVDLSHNDLAELPARLFHDSPELHTLNLSHNKLGAGAAEVVGAATSLRVLHMEANPLGDLCEGGASTDTIWIDADSSLRKLKHLKWLDLSSSHVIRICRDWRDVMEELEYLGLSATNITQLTYSELQFKRKSKTTVELRGVPLERLEYTREEYEHAAREAVRGPTIEVHADAIMRCDCNQYWAVQAFREGHGGVQLNGLRCGPHPFADTPPERLVCNASELCPGLSSGCACLLRPDREPPGNRVRLECEHAHRDAVPRVNHSAEYAWSLHLAFNRIADLSPSDLPPLLREVDLRNNSISRLDVPTVAALLRHPESRLNLSGNPLECGCGQHEALAALQRAGAGRVDFADATCGGVGGPPLHVPLRCPLWEWVAGGVALLGIGLAVTVATLSRPSARLRLKVALARLGWVSWGVAGDGTRFDAFVSYAHQDEEVVHEIAARLEGGRSPLRLCLHQRDWVPGGWIPAQIAASVRASRCTIAVVSEHYVRSGWARAEFREAHAAALRDLRPRLLVVLLAEPAALPLDAELRNYLTANTYVLWGDPWFWEKLSVALRSSKESSAGDGSGGGDTDR